MELHPLEPDLGQEGPSKAPSASRTFHPVHDRVAFPKDTVGMGVLGLTWDPMWSWEHPGETARSGAPKGSALLSEGPRRCLRCRGVGGSLCFCLLWIAARFGTQYSAFGMGGARGLLEPEVEEQWWRGLGEAPAAQRAWGVLGWALCVPPGVTEPGIHGLGRSFGHRHRRELPLLHPKGNRILRRDRHRDSTPGAPAGQGGLLQSPSPSSALCNSIF